MRMNSTLDAFREQREAVEQLHRRLFEVGEMLGLLRERVELLAGDKELRAVLQQEESWLHHVERTVAEVRAWRREEARRFWPGLIRRWTLALAFALVSVAVAGAAYARITEPHAAELWALRSRAEFGDAIARRIASMTPIERRQFDGLMKWSATPK
jgi:hypothetical protein